MNIRSSYWFGATLLSVLFLLWFVVLLVEPDEVDASFVWGLIIFGPIAVVTGVMTVLTFFAQGGRLSKRDDLLSTDASPPPRSSHGTAFRSSDRRLAGSGEAPRPSSGRSLLG